MILVRLREALDGVAQRRARGMPATLNPPQLVLPPPPSANRESDGQFVEGGGGSWRAPPPLRHGMNSRLLTAITPSCAAVAAADFKYRAPSDVRQAVQFL